MLLEDITRDGKEGNYSLREGTRAKARLSFLAIVFAVVVDGNELYLVVVVR